MDSPYYQLLAVILCVTAAMGTQAASTIDSSFYTAGVVEFLPTIAAMTSADLVKENLAAYLEIIASAAAEPTDIIVFPEGTLNNALQLTQVPAAHDGVIPCESASDGYADFLVSLSCAARQARKYLVINLTEMENCPAAGDPRPCAANGRNVYNTNVVLDREGRVISRYRKVHIYLEAVNETYTPEFAMFDTDFGVRFGHFICFDLLFYTPAEELVVKHGIRDVIFTSLFYSELPFLTGVQLQHSWAWGNNVNLLAAGASYPQSGSTGSGIYAGEKGDLVSIMVGETGVRKLLVAQVPKMGPVSLKTRTFSNNSLGTNYPASPTPAPAPRAPQTGVKLLRDPQIHNFNSQLLDLVNEHYFVRRLCMDGFCCRFDIVTAAPLATAAPAPDSVFYKYRIGVFKGQRSYEKEAYSDLQICAVYACTNDSVASCGEMFDARTASQANFRFKAIDIVGDFEKAEKLLLMPNSLNDQLYPLAAAAVKWQVVDQGNYFSVSYNLTSEADNLLAFGIYANYYDRSAASMRYVNFMALFIGSAGLILITWLKF